MNNRNTSSVTLTLRPDYDELPLLRHVIRQTLPPLTEDQQSRYLGAVTEIAVNAIDASPPEAVVLVTLVIAPTPSVTISDAGAGFDVDGPRKGRTGSLGMGLPIATATVPGIVIESTSTGSTVTLPYPQQVAS